MRLANAFDLQRHPDLRRAVRRARLRNRRWWRSVLPAVLLYVGSGIASVVVSLRGAVMVGQAIFLPGYVLAIAWAFTWVCRHRDWMRRQYTDAGHCGRCLYGLSGLRAEADGCTVCPECGAAWRLTPAEGQPSA